MRTPEEDTRWALLHAIEESRLTRHQAKTLSDLVLFVGANTDLTDNAGGLWGSVIDRYRDLVEAWTARHYACVHVCKPDGYCVRCDKCGHLGHFERLVDATEYKNAHENEPGRTGAGFRTAPVRHGGGEAS